MPTIPFKLAERWLDALGRCAAVLRPVGCRVHSPSVGANEPHTCAARLRAERLRAASGRVRHESMQINAEFDSIERDVDA